MVYAMYIFSQICKYNECINFDFFVQKVFTNVVR